MKFGNYLQDRRQALSPDWADNCIDYVALKAYIKQQILPYTVSFEPNYMTWEPASVNDLSFADTLQFRLSKLTSNVALFVKKMDAQVEKFTQFYGNETQRLVNEFNAGNKNPQDLLKDVVRFEKYIYLNYTGKICSFIHYLYIHFVIARASKDLM